MAAHLLSSKRHHSPFTSQTTPPAAALSTLSTSMSSSTIPTTGGIQVNHAIDCTVLPVLSTVPDLSNRAHTPTVITTATVAVARDDALSSPGSSSSDDDDLELPKFAYKARTRNLTKRLAPAAL
ncbi:hypothetical protein D9615_008642 [Tricholomella constricta]|uniref:Uncharacterized protein n=1 Tax=Tricholomella constricta TaxID=117010 RepID=A0A8H5H4D6_9AGAR|nr:hypothetical protein D9615_008642 [Tricholomella constricta]